MVKVFVGAVIFAATAGVAFALPGNDASTIRVKVVKNEGGLVLLVPPPYVVEGAPVAQCKISGLSRPCYILRKAVKVEGSQETKK